VNEAQRVDEKNGIICRFSMCRFHDIGILWTKRSFQKWYDLLCSDLIFVRYLSLNSVEKCKRKCWFISFYRFP